MGKIKNIFLICVILILTGSLLVASLFINHSKRSTRNILAYYQELVESGEIETCRDELTRALERTPDWHEGRAFLIELEIELGHYISATKHMFVLAKADYDIKALETALLAKRSTQPFSVLEQAFAEGWAWPRLFSLRLAIAVSDLERVYANWVWLRELQPGMPELATIQEQVWNDDLAIAWVISDSEAARKKIIHELYTRPSVHRLSFFMKITDPTDIELLALQARDIDSLLSLEKSGFSPLYPDLYGKRKFEIMAHWGGKANKGMVNWIRFADLAEYMTGSSPNTRFAVDLMTAMEASGTAPDTDEFRTLKLKCEILLLGPRHLNQEAMDIMGPSLLWATTLEWMDSIEFKPEYKNYVQTILNHLSTLPEWSRYASYYNKALNPPAAPSPALGINSKELWSVSQVWLEKTALSPDGKHLLLLSRDNAHSFRSDIINIDTGERLLITLAPLFDKSAWSPDSRYLALQYDNKLLIYDLVAKTQIATVAVENSQVDMRMLGWNSQGQLLWFEPAILGYQVYSFDAAKGLRDKYGSADKAYPVLTATGRLALIQGINAYGKTTGGSLKIIIEEKSYTFSVPEDCWLGDWLPEDRGLLLGKIDTSSLPEKQYFLLDLTSNQRLDLDIPRFNPFSGGWLNQHQVVGHFTVRKVLNYEESDAFHDQVMVLDIRDMSLTPLGLKYVEAPPFGGRVMVHHGDGGIKIYILR